MKPTEVIPVSALEVACDGSGGPLGHPRVFLHMDPDVGLVVCPYCSRTYELKLLSSKKPAAPPKRI